MLNRSYDDIVEMNEENERRRLKRGLDRRRYTYAAYSPEKRSGIDRRQVMEGRMAEIKKIWSIYQKQELSQAEGDNGYHGRQ